jgi:hypothetical protein
VKGDKGMDGRKMLMYTLSKQDGDMRQIFWGGGRGLNDTGLFGSARNFCGCKHKLLKRDQVSCSP